MVCHISIENSQNKPLAPQSLDLSKKSTSTAWPPTPGPIQTAIYGIAHCFHKGPYQAYKVPLIRQNIARP